ncbi:hypothetical protein Tco_0296785 [Tanacetum coccineum]
MNNDEGLDHKWEGLSCHNWIRIRYENICRTTKERILRDYWRNELNDHICYSEKIEDRKDPGRCEDKGTYWASCNLYKDECDGGGLSSTNKQYWETSNDSERQDLEWEELSFNDWVRIKYGKVCKMTKDRILKDYWIDKFNEEHGDMEGIDEDGGKAQEEM